MRQYGLLRALGQAESSDGILRYLRWIAVPLTPRPPELMVMSEPETSLHPDLVPPLARLIAKAAQRSQVWVVTHSNRLAAALEAVPEAGPIHLVKQLGEIPVFEQGLLERPPSEWLAR